MAGAAGREVNAEDVLGLLERLVEQSLVEAEVAGKEPRYGRPEPVRQYALQKLEESGEARTIGRGHASYFLALAERAYPELMGARQVDCVERAAPANEHPTAARARSWPCLVRSRAGRTSVSRAYGSSSGRLAGASRPGERQPYGRRVVGPGCG